MISLTVVEATWIIHWLVLTFCHSGGGNLDRTVVCVDFCLVRVVIRNGMWI